MGGRGDHGVAQFLHPDPWIGSSLPPSFNQARVSSVRMLAKDKRQEGLIQESGGRSVVASSFLFLGFLHFVPPV